MNKSRIFALIAAVSLAGCGGGGGAVSVGGPSVPQTGSGTPSSSPNPASTSGAPAPDYSAQEAFNLQFSGTSGTIRRFDSEVAVAQQSDRSEEVYDPNTESSLSQAFSDAGVAEVVAGRTSSAFLIGDTTYGVGQAAQDFLAGAGLASDAYTFLDIGEQGRTSRSAYLSTPENSIVNIMSSPLYISSQTDGLGGLIISPEDVQQHGWILSDTGFDGDIDPIAGISSREWLGESGSKVAAGYRSALDTGKVRLFYGLNVDGETRNNTSNGCQGVEQYCIGTPYSLRVKNSRGGYIDVDGTFVSTYGFAAYVMAWERMGAATHVREVFAMGDRCTVDLGESGHDADTGRGRLDIGCLARLAYESQLPAEEADPVNPPSVQPVQPVAPVVQPVVQPQVTPPVTVALNPPPAEQIAEETVTATVTVTSSNLEVDPEPAVSITVAQPEVDAAPTVTITSPSATVEVDPEPAVSITVAQPEADAAPTVTITSPSATVEVDPEPAVSITVAQPEVDTASTVTVASPSATVEVESQPTATVTVAQPEVDTASTVTVASPSATVEVESQPTATVTVAQPEVDTASTVTVTSPPTTIEIQTQITATVTVAQPLVVEEPLPEEKVQIDYWERKISPNTFGKELNRLGLESVTDRKMDSYMIGHKVYWIGSNHCPGFEYFLGQYEYLTGLHNIVAAGNKDLLKEMGLQEDNSYIYLASGNMVQNFDYNDMYRLTSENNLVHFQTNPFYLGGPRAWFYFAWDWGMEQETMLESSLIAERGWIVSETGFDVDYVMDNGWQRENWPYTNRFRINDYRKADQPNYHAEYQARQRKLMEDNYNKALATGKVRLFYGLNSDQTGRDPLFLDCTDFEEYCIGVPHPYNSHYAFGVYLQAWQRLPAETHISAVFAIGDQCTEDLGAAGPDADTGLGRLDIGCMAYKVYKVNLDPASATLTVAARLPSSTNDDQTSSNDGGSLLSSDGQGGLQLNAQSAPPSFAAASSNDPAQQQFFDDFAQDLFSHLGSLWLPGGTDAGFAVGFPGDSFEGTYRPAHGKGIHYDPVLPSARYARSAGSVGLMGMASSGEVGIFTRIEGVDVSFSYVRSEDFFGGKGSGDFSFDQVGNSRLMLHTQVLPEGDEHTLGVGGWVRHAAVSGGRGRLLDDLRGVEYGLSMNYGWQGQGGLRVEATAYGARFAGGDVELAGGDRFAIGASDWKWGVRLGGSYQF